MRHMRACMAHCLRHTQWYMRLSGYVSARRLPQLRLNARMSATGHARKQRRARFESIASLSLAFQQMRARERRGFPTFSLEPCWKAVSSAHRQHMALPLHCATMQAPDANTSNTVGVVWKKRFCSEHLALKQPWIQGTQLVQQSNLESDMELKRGIMPCTMHKPGI